MGLFMDLIQSSEIDRQKARTKSLEQRVATLERELHHTREIFLEALKRIDRHFDRDVDDDGPDEG